MKAPLAFLAGLAAGGLLTAVLLPSARPPSPPPAEIEQLRALTEHQQQQITEQERAIASQNDAIHRLHADAAPTLAAATPTPKPQNPLTGLAALMDNPAMRKMMGDTMRRVAETNYADLVAQFHFTPEEREQFLDLVAAREQIATDYGMKMLKLPPDQRKDLAAQQADAEKKADDALREFFNNDQDYATYTTYTRQQAQRHEMQALQPGFQSIGQPLTPEQEKSLLGILQTEHTPPAAKGESDPADPASPAGQARLLERQAQRQQRVAARAAAILSPEQLEVLKTNQARQLAAMKAGMEMSRTLLGQPDSEK